MTFIPEQPKEHVQNVPFYDDVTSSDGWQGHTTSKAIETLKAEIIASIGRLGGLVTGFQPGGYQLGEHKRSGYRILYVIEKLDGTFARGQLDMAALPVKPDKGRQRSFDTRQLKSIKMAMFMLRNALDGAWFLQQLSPGFAPLMPWMLMGESGKTVTQVWSEGDTMKHLLPEGNSDFIIGEFK